MTATKFDRVVDDLSAQVGRLDRKKQTAFFAACGEALFPLYDQFSREAKWGDAGLLRKALDAAWRYVEDGSKLGASELASKLESLTPHTDDFETPASIYAQDAVICVDAALRSASESEQPEPAYVEYALEPTKVALSLQKRGLIDVGSSREDIAWLDTIVNEPRMVSALESLRRAISLLNSANPLRPNDTSVLRATTSALRP